MVVLIMTMMSQGQSAVLLCRGGRGSMLSVSYLSPEQASQGKTATHASKSPGHYMCRDQRLYCNSAGSQPPATLALRFLHHLCCTPPRCVFGLSQAQVTWVIIVRKIS